MCEGEQESESFLSTCNTFSNQQFDTVWLEANTIQVETLP